MRESDDRCPGCGSQRHAGIIDGKNITYCCTPGCFSVGLGWHIIPRDAVVVFLRIHCTNYPQFDSAGPGEARRV